MMSHFIKACSSQLKRGGLKTTESTEHHCFCDGCSGWEEDVAPLKSIVTAVATEIGLNGSGIPDDYTGEVVRFGAAELHSVAAVVGGIAAQEAIKLLTSQFIPLQGTLIYNAMAGTSAVF